MPKKQTNDELLTKFAEVLERETPLRPEDHLQDIEEWDSLGILSLISLIDDEYNITIGSKDLERMEVVQDILDFISKK